MCNNLIVTYNNNIIIMIHDISIWFDFTPIHNISILYPTVYACTITQLSIILHKFSIRICIIQTVNTTVILEYFVYLNGALCIKDLK